MAVLNHDGFASRPNVGVHKGKVSFTAATIQLPRVKSVFNQRVHIALDLLLALLGTEFAMVRADAVVAVCRYEGMKTRKVREHNA